MQVQVEVPDRGAGGARRDLVGRAPGRLPRETVPVERLLKDRKTRQAAPAAVPIEFVPVPVQAKPTEAPAPAGAQ